MDFCVSVLNLVEQELPLEKNKNELFSEKVNQALLCYMAWQTETDPLCNWESFTSRLIHIVQECAVPHGDSE